MGDRHVVPNSSLESPLLAFGSRDQNDDVGTRSGLDLSDENDVERVRPGDTASSDDPTTSNVLAPGTLSFKAGVAICCADIIGSGIFASPGIVLKWTGSVGAALLAWTIAGVITYVGFACLAELSVLDPNAGGLFYYARVAFGSATAFSWTFTNFTVIVPGSLGALALTFAHYLCSAVPGWEAGGFQENADWKVQLVAVAAIAAAAALNCLSAAHGGSVAKVFLTATLLGCVFVFALGIVGAMGWGNDGVGDAMDITTNATANATAPQYPSSAAFENFNPHRLWTGTRNISSLGVGLISALWAFSGAMDVASMGEELRDPQRTLPRVGMTGLAIVSTVYISLNVAYLLVLPAAAIANPENGSSAMGVEFAKAVAGGWAGFVVTIVVAMSSFGALNSCMYLNARQFYATARDGFFPKALAMTNERKAPHVAIVAVAFWTAVLTCAMSSFVTLVNYLSCAMWLYYGLVGVAVFKSRVTYPDVERPYEVPGWPVVPFFFIIACVYLSACTFAASPLECGCALLFVATAFPVHEFMFVWWPARAGRAVQVGGGGSDVDDDEL